MKISSSSCYPDTLLAASSLASLKPDEVLLRVTDRNHLDLSNTSTSSCIQTLPQSPQLTSHVFSNHQTVRQSSGRRSFRIRSASLYARVSRLDWHHCGSCKCLRIQERIETFRQGQLRGEEAFPTAQQGPSTTIMFALCTLQVLSTIPGTLDKDDKT